MSQDLWFGLACGIVFGAATIEAGAIPGVAVYLTAVVAITVSVIERRRAEDLGGGR